MKKYIAIIAAIAVLGTAGIVVVNKRLTSKTDDNKESQSYSQAVSGESSDSAQSQDSSKSEESERSSESQAAKDVSSFFCEVDSVSGTNMIVVPDKNSAERKSSDKISLDFSKAAVTDEKGKKVSQDDIKNFSRAKIYYNGEIRETYPASITAQRIVLSGREYCNIYFYSELTGELLKTHRVPVGSNLDSADMPNAGAACPDGYHFEGWSVDGKDINGLKNITDSVTVTAKIRKD